MLVWLLLLLELVEAFKLIFWHFLVYGNINGFLNYSNTKINIKK